MSNWSSLKIHIDPLEKLKPPLKAALSVLETIEAVLEALLKLVKMFMLDLLNPIRAIIALLLAAIRAILAQIKATGFAILLVRPDFRRSDLRAVFNSVSGGYKKFETKVVGKFYDEADPLRPTYTPGMYVAMLIFYIGAESPRDLISEIYALLNLIKHPMDDIGLAAPVGLKVSTPTKSGNPVAQFWQLFAPSDASKSLVLEWKMPTAAAGLDSPTLIGQIVSSLPTWNLGQKFIIERTDADHPTGEVVYAKLESKTQGTRVQSMVKKFNVPSVSTKVSVKERGGGVYRFFRKRMKVDDSTYLGGLTGTYRYIDTQLEEGKTYYYRVRAYMGDIDSAYFEDGMTPESAATKICKQDPQHGWIVNFGKKVVVGKPSAVVRGYVPLQVSNSEIFDLYKDLLNAVLAALLLNFELPFPSAEDSATVLEQKTGWGTLCMMAGPIGAIKSSNSTASEFVQFPFLKPAIRRVVNPVLEKLRVQPALVRRLGKMWSEGVNRTVGRILGGVGFEFTAATAVGLDGVKSIVGKNQQTGAPQTTTSWGLFGVVGDITDDINQSITKYLGKEDSDFQTKPGAPYTGPLPLRAGATDGSVFATAQERSDLADFLRLALSVTDQSARYLQWYSVTIGDLFPSIVPFMFDFEQWVLQLLKAIESALKELQDIIETLIQRVRDLEQLVKAIIALIEILQVDVTASLLFVTGSNGVDDLVQGIMTSENKPVDKPFGLHSGLVMTAGGPGPGFVKAIDALKFLITAGSK